MNASLIILGSGTSMGVPTLGCDCRVCTSSDPRDRRLRPSAAVVWPSPSNAHHVIIDTGPDFREQALANGIGNVDAVLYTHSHADHILGMDDLRPLSYKNAEKIPLYADNPTARAKNVNDALAVHKEHQLWERMHPGELWDSPRR